MVSLFNACCAVSTQICGNTSTFAIKLENFGILLKTTTENNTQI